jgi:hypothetical protein
MEITNEFLLTAFIVGTILMLLTIWQKGFGVKYSFEGAVLIPMAIVAYLVKIVIFVAVILVCKPHFVEAVNHAKDVGIDVTYGLELLMMFGWYVLGTIIEIIIGFGIILQIAKVIVRNH